MGRIGMIEVCSIIDGKQPYIFWDELGITNINCMCCDQEIVHRRMSDLPGPNGKHFLVHAKDPRYGEKEYMLSDGSKCRLFLCVDCKNKEFDAEDKAAIIRKIQLAAVQELNWAGRSLTEAKDYHRKLKLLEIKDARKLF